MPGGGGGLSGRSGFMNGVQDIFVLIFNAIFAGFYIGADFSNRTIQNQLAAGHSRFHIILSKSIVFFAGASLILLLYPSTISLIHTLFSGWGEDFTVSSAFYVLRVCLLGVLLNIGTTSVFVLFAFLCRDIPKTICLCCAFPVVFSLLSSIFGSLIPAAGDVIHFTTLAQLKYITAEPLPLSAILSILLSAVITTVFFIYLSHYLFSKAEIK